MLEQSRVPRRCLRPDARSRLRRRLLAPARSSCAAFSVLPVRADNHQQRVACGVHCVRCRRAPPGSWATTSAVSARGGQVQRCLAASVIAPAAPRRAAPRAGSSPLPAAPAAAAMASGVRPVAVRRSSDARAPSARLVWWLVRPARRIPAARAVLRVRAGRIGASIEQYAHHVRHRPVWRQTSGPCAPAGRRASALARPPAAPVPALTRLPFTAASSASPDAAPAPCASNSAASARRRCAPRFPAPSPCLSRAPDWHPPPAVPSLPAASCPHGRCGTGTTVT